VNEHDDEPVPGLPAALPESERILWQGAPATRALAIHAFHVRKVAIYFGVLAAWRALEGVQQGQGAAELFTGAAWLVALGVAVVALLTGLAHLSARSALYTITSRRIVMRHGVALSLSVNLPFAAVDAAQLRRFRDGSGEVLVSLGAGQRLGYLLNWPYVRPWHFTRPQAALRGLAKPQEAADVLIRAWDAANPAQQAGEATRGTPVTDVPALGAAA
jgi:hypothetical protein